MMSTVEEVQDMAMVQARDHRDLAIFQAWVDGAHQDALATQYGVQQPAVSKAISRVCDTLPEPDRVTEVRRTLRLIDDLLQVYIPKSKQGMAWANREVRGLLALKGRFLGVDRREVQVDGLVQIQVQVEPPEVIVERILAKQQELPIIEAELVE
jgi:hypothetical protein